MPVVQRVHEVVYYFRVQKGVYKDDISPTVCPMPLHQLTKWLKRHQCAKLCSCSSGSGNKKCLCH